MHKTDAYPWTITSHPYPPKTHGYGWAWVWAPNVGLCTPDMLSGELFIRKLLLAFVIINIVSSMADLRPPNILTPNVMDSPPHTTSAYFTRVSPPNPHVRPMSQFSTKWVSSNNPGRKPWCRTPGCCATNISIWCDFSGLHVSHPLGDKSTTLWASMMNWCIQLQVCFSISSFPTLGSVDCSLYLELRPTKIHEPVLEAT